MELCNLSLFTRTSKSSALYLIEEAYSGYTNKGDQYDFVLDLLDIDTNLIVLTAEIPAPVGMTRLIHIPYPDNIANLITIPTGLSCNTGLTLNLTDIQNNSLTNSTCQACTACDGATDTNGSCCNCTCMGGCGICIGNGCPAKNCCGSGGQWQEPFTICNDSSNAKWVDSSPLSDIDLWGNLETLIYTPIGGGGGCKFPKKC